MEGKLTEIKLGNYPALSLSRARELAAAIKVQVQSGLDPRQERRKRQRVQVSFAQCADEWFRLQVPRIGATTVTRQRSLLDKDLLPALGASSIASLETADLLQLLKAIERRAPSMAHFALDALCGVWAHAMQQGYVKENVAERLRPPKGSKTQGVLQPRKSGRHYAAILNPEEFGVLLHTIRTHDGNRRRVATQAALELAPLLFQRPGNLQQMQWAELDLSNALWTIPAAKMKRSLTQKEHGEPHLVPLPRQAVQILAALQPFTDSPEYGGWVFPGDTNHTKPMSDATLRMALQRVGVPKQVQTLHGFRASARTMLDEVLQADWRHIEAHLAHTVPDPLGRAYNRTNYLAQRRDMVQRWADWLDELAAGAAAHPRTCKRIREDWARRAADG